MLHNLLLFNFMLRIYYTYNIHYDINIKEVFLIFITYLIILLFYSSIPVNEKHH